MSGEMNIPKSYTCYNVHSETIQFLTRLENLRREKPASTTEESIEDVQEYWDSVTRLVNKEISFEGHVWVDKIPLEEVPGGIPVTVFKPQNIVEKPSILVHFHGGGFVIGSRITSQEACKTISRESGCICVNVEYRLAPEVTPHTIFNDARLVMQYVLQNKSRFGGTMTSTVGVSGDSAGGTIAANICHDVPGIDYQVLVYGSFDRTYNFQSVEEFADDAILPKDKLKWFKKAQSPNTAVDWKDPKLSAMFRSSFEGLPPALFIVAQLDPCRDSSILYNNKLRDAGVQTELHIFEGITHSFFVNPGIFPENCKRAYTCVSKFISKFQP